MSALLTNALTRSAPPHAWDAATRPRRLSTSDRFPIAALAADPLDRGAQSIAGAGSRRAVLVALGGITVAALALRVLLASRSGLWIDETQLIWTIRFASVGDVIHFVANHDSHPPLFYLLMRGWLWVFGDTEAAALAPNILLGVATVVALHRIGSRAFSPAAGLIAATLAACSPLLAWHSAEVRPYSFLALLCLLSTHALWSALRHAPELDAIRGPRIRAWAAYVAATVAMILTHNWSWLVWGGQGLVVLAWWAVRGAGGRTSIRAAVIAQLVIAAACALWVPTLLHQARHAGHGPATVTLEQFTKVFSSLVFSFDNPGRGWVLAGLLAAAGWRPVLGMARRAISMHQASSTTAPAACSGPALGVALYLGAPLAAATAAAAMSWRNNLLVPHSLTIISPCLILAVAHVLAGLPQWRARRVPAFLRAAPALLLTGLVAATHLQLLLTEPFVKSNAREVAAAVNARATPTDLTVVLPEWYGSSFYYYYPLDRPRGDHPVADFNGAFEYNNVAQRLARADALDPLKRQLLDARRQGRRVWVVTDRRWLDLSRGGQHPAHLSAGAYRRVAFTRAAEIRHYLDALYGAPKQDAIPADTRYGWSMMDALLYAPPPGSSTFARAQGERTVGPPAPVGEHASINIEE